MTLDPIPYRDIRPEARGYTIERLVNEQADPDSLHAKGESA
jgi:hypothetical protein